MDEEMMEAVNNQAHQTYLEAVRDPATETMDRDLSIDIQYTSKFIDDERVEDAAEKIRREILRNAITKNTDDLDQYRRRYISDET